MLLLLLHTTECLGAIFGAVTLTLLRAHTHTDGTESECALLDGQTEKVICWQIKHLSEQTDSQEWN